MLCVAPKGRIEPATHLSEAEDRLLRRAFGRYGDPAHRAAAAAVVRRWQVDGPGHWILCDCHGVRIDDERPPALVPVAEAHLRRHVHGCWPTHAPDCDFFKDPSEQRATTMSYRSDNRVEPVVRGFGGDPSPYRVRLSGNSQAEDRPKLARLLMRLLDNAGLSKVAPSMQRQDVAAHYRMLWKAARRTQLTDKLRIGSYLETYPQNYDAFCQRIEAVPETLFKGSRPHGIIVCVARAVSEGAIGVDDRPPLPVLGRISVFGEREGHGRVQNTADRRPPYLVAGLVARPGPGAPATILRAYAHPVASRSQLVLVDSDYERRTLKRLMGLQVWLLRYRTIIAMIEKPLFDIGMPDDDLTKIADGARAEAFDERGARPPIIPDFVVRAKAANGATATVIVETMGYGDRAYLERKERVHPLMRAALNQAPMVLHQCHSGSGDPEEVDREMGRQVLRAIFEQIEPQRSQVFRSPSPGVPVL